MTGACTLAHEEPEREPHASYGSTRGKSKSASEIGGFIESDGGRAGVEQRNRARDSATLAAPVVDALNACSRSLDV